MKQVTVLVVVVGLLSMGLDRWRRYRTERDKPRDERSESRG